MAPPANPFLLSLLCSQLTAPSRAADLAPGLGSELAASPAVLAIQELEASQQALLRSVVWLLNQLLDLRALSTGIHSTRLAEWAVRIARQLEIPSSDWYQLEVAALLHDIGKIGIPDAVLRKPGRLTDEE